MVNSELFKKKLRKLETVKIIAL